MSLPSLHPDTDSSSCCSAGWLLGVSTWCGAMLEYYLGEGEDVCGSSAEAGWWRLDTAEDSGEDETGCSVCPAPHSGQGAAITLSPRHHSNSVPCISWALTSDQ